MPDIKTPRLAVLVNTCDKFEDCWSPFFVLWKKFGLKTLDHAVYLNTERKIFNAPDTPVRSLRVCEANGWTGPKPPTWSWCLEKALDAISETFVLYLQEDYFLQSQIDESAIRSALERMAAHPSIGCVHLTNIGIKRTFSSMEFDIFRKGDPRDWYYVSCQAALWRKDVLRGLLREHEDAWQFERWASKRARWTGLKFYVLDNVEKSRPIDYIRTGIIQGKWYGPAVLLFREHGIKMDYSKRGFYEGKYGRRKGRPISWRWTWLRYNIRAFAVRFFLPWKSFREVSRLRFGIAPSRK